MFPSELFLLGSIILMGQVIQWAWLAVLAIGFLSCGRLGFDHVDDDGRTITEDSMPLSNTHMDSVSRHSSVGCAISSGALYCWGDPISGRIPGADLAGPVMSPLRIGSGSDWRQVSVGGTHACAVKADKSIWCWGESYQGALGLGDTYQAPPTQLNVTLLWEVVDSGYSHTCAISSGGQLWCWGNNMESQVGVDDQGYSSGGASEMFDVPTRVGNESDWTVVSAGDGHTCGIRANELWCWGRNAQGEAAQDTTLLQLSVPVLVSSGWTDVEVAMVHSCGIRDDQSLWCWGNGLSGQLGQNNPEIASSPLQVGNFNDWTDVGGGGFHSCGLRSQDTLWCWGRTQEGQQGNSEVEPTSVPGAGATSTAWTEIIVSRFGTCAIDADRSLWCTGKNNAGQLGLGSTNRPNEFTKVQFP